MVAASGFAKSRAAWMLAQAVSDLDARLLSVGSFTSWSDRKAGGFGSVTGSGSVDVLDAGGRRWVRSQGGYLTTASSACLSSSTECTILLVASGIAPGASAMTMAQLSSGATNRFSVVYNDTTGGLSSGSIRAAIFNGATYRRSPSVDLTASTVLSIRLRRGLSGAVAHDIRANGVQQSLTTVNGPADATGNWASDALYLFANNAGAAVWQGRIARLLLWPSWPTDTDLAAVEAVA